MARVKRLIVGLGLSLLIVPVLIAQLGRSDNRELTAVSLDAVEYREVQFRNDLQDLSLAGMLLVPDGEGPFPAAVFIHGSGPSHRNNGWYLTVAQYLRENDVVVLLPDKRGSGKSEGDWRTASLQDLATDTAAAIEFLRGQDSLEISSMGVIGMSQGGTIAPIVANRADGLDYLVNVVGGAMPMYQGLVYEETHNLREIGLLPGISDLLAYPAAWSLIYVRQSGFWSAVGNFDPLPYWEEVAANALVLYGSADTNVHSIRSAELLRSLGKENIKVVVYPGSGHALESPQGEGNSIFRQDALAKISDFIHSVDGP